ALAIARSLDLGLWRVLAGRARDLHALPTAGLSSRDGLVRWVCHLQRAPATRVLRLPRALPLLRPVAARRACLFHAQSVPANRLTREPVSHPALHDRLCRLGQGYPPDRDLRPLDLSQEPAPRCPPRERQHELAAESSLDLRL